MVMDLVQTLGNTVASAANVLAGAAASRIGGGAAFNNNNSQNGNSLTKKDASKDGDEAADDVVSDPAVTHVPFALMAIWINCTGWFVTRLESSGILSQTWTLSVAKAGS
jgi:hypothetical protein